MPTPTDSNQDDSELWNAFRAGDDVAFGKIARQYYRSLFSYGVKFSKDREFVKDCIQDLFMELWAKRETIGDTAFVKFYLLKSLRRKIHRESQKQSWLTDDDDLDFEAENLGESSIEQQIIDIETSEAMLKMLNQQINLLTKRQQEVIYLRFFENLDNESIAQVMSISKQAVANLLYRTIQELKDRL
ncbi:RNA polymerase sigma factor [Dyadobacter frigoris]|uniref:Sigma-70 family RNA polymerase sigma factor n=1 Tax=Dyadobacter frigoris TaxID=2576211 RepID=A0A4U6D612_9BACT|nr:sigma-70 family RNA polymerase sigma factor [Dyadobacter frigoris]TKT92819.1 sigma-70 family RNA polymerase sigma factor [Dyadobacter frigoris]GLU54417.1 DNA-directed RNA polymerase sigma-70 factor [Dyadobacter frigoris]